MTIFLRATGLCVTCQSMTLPHEFCYWVGKPYCKCGYLISLQDGKVKMSCIPALYLDPTGMLSESIKSTGILRIGNLNCCSLFCFISKLII